MDCKEFEKLIPDFFDLKINFRTMKEFREHWENCPGCQDELEIQFLIRKGMQHLEEGDAFDLQWELGRHLEEADRKVRFHRRFIQVGVALEILAAIGLAVVILWIFQF